MLRVLVLFLILTLGSCAKAIPNFSNAENQQNIQIDTRNSVEIPIDDNNSAPFNTETTESSTPDSISIAYINNGSFNQDWKLIGSCSNESELIKMSYWTQVEAESTSVYLPCVDGKWLYNEMSGTSVYRVVAQHGNATSEMYMSNPTAWTGPEIDCDPDEPYVWRHELTDIFRIFDDEGNPVTQCHAVAYCESGRPYLYSDSISSGCSY